MIKVQKKRIGDIVTFKRGYDLPSQNRVAGDYPIYSSSGLTGFHNDYKAEGEGLITGRYGTLGKMYYVTGKYWPHNTALYATDFHGNIPKYVYYLMQSLNEIKRPDKSTVPGVNRNDLHELLIPYIEPIYQKGLAAVLSTLDAKIALNQRINRELEEMAKTIYDYWFVQFDFPYDFEAGRPDPAGRPYKSSGGRMVWSEVLKREVPEGWEVEMLGDLLNTSLGGTPSTSIKEYWENGTINWLNSGEIANFPIIDSELKITESAVFNSATNVLPKGSVVLSITRHLRPSILGINACANQSVVGIKENGDIKCYYLYPYLQNEIPRLMTMRSGAQQPHINKEIVDESFILTPSESSGILKAYNKKVGNLYDLIINNAFQNQHLTSLRDWLLPMLMNGQVEVGGETH